MKHEEAFGPDDQESRPKSAFLHPLDETGPEPAEDEQDWEEDLADDGDWEAEDGDWEADGSPADATEESEVFAGLFDQGEGFEQSEDFDGQDFEDGEVDTPAPSVRSTGRSSRRTARTGGRSPSGTMWTGLGWTLTATGLGLGVASMAAPEALRGLTQVTDNLGLTPVVLLVVGVILAVHGASARRVAWLDREHEDRMGRLDQHLEALAEQASRTSSSGSGDVADLQESVDRTLIALDRQDEKINNLTRATKMYGKPLIDISKQVSEVANQMADAPDTDKQLQDLETRLLEGMTERVDGALKRAVATWESTSLVSEVDEATAERLADILAATRRNVTNLDDVKALVRELADTPNGPDPRAIQKSVRKEIDAALQQELGTLADQLKTQLTEQLEAARPEPSPAAPTVDLSGVEGSLGQLQTELQRIATRLSQLETAAPAAAAAPAAGRPAPAAAAPTPTPQSSAAPTANGDGPAEKIAGSSKQKGSNVLGAIAKLRAMKG